MTTATKWENNIKACYNRATLKDREDGTRWYSEVSARCQKWAAEFQKPFEIVVGVYAVLSPGTTWALNERDAYHVLKFGKAWKTATYKANHVKALRLIAGEPFDKVNGKEGKKVRAFFHSILGAPDSVCVDRHAGAIAEGRKLTEEERKTLRRRKYDAIADAYKKAAAVLGIPPVHLQAITWTAYRRNLERKLSEATPF